MSSTEVEYKTISILLIFIHMSQNTNIFTSNTLFYLPQIYLNLLVNMMCICGRPKKTITCASVKNSYITLKRYISYFVLR